MTHCSYSASPGASLLTLCPLPVHQYPISAKPGGVLPPQWTSVLHCGTCSVDIPVRSLWCCPVFGPTVFCSWLGSLDVPWALCTTPCSRVWASIDSQLTFLNEQPALTSPWHCQKTVKRLEWLCCQNSFSRC